MKDIQVVYIVTKLELGGAQKVCLSLFEGIPRAGLDATLISGASGPLAHNLRSSKQCILLESMKREIHFSTLFLEVKNFFKLVRTLKKIKRESSKSIAVHTHSTKAGLIGRWAAFFAGIKTRIHTVHGYGFHEYQSRLIWCAIFFLEWITSFITTHFICVSSKDVQTGLRLLHNFERKHSIIRAAVEWKNFYIPATRIKSTTHFIFGSIACFKPQKNIIDLLKAFKRVHTTFNHARLELIGDGILRPTIEKWITDNNMGAFITLHGWQHEVGTIMKNWHAFTLSSLWEGLPCAIVEARLMHLPVVAYDTGGIHDVIFDHINGLLYKKGNWRGLATGMKLLMSEKNLYTKMKLYRENLNDFKNSYMVHEHVRLYKAIVHQKQ